MSSSVPSMPSRLWIGLLTWFSICGWALPAWAGFCGDDDCGDHGSCDQVSLLGKCDCDDGYASVRTHLGDGRLGAYCVPLAAPPSETACDDFECGPHGVCVVSAGDAGDAGDEAGCICDPGYEPDGTTGCRDNPDDDAERACATADCGEGATCMAVSDALTCRCAPGGSVVLGRGTDGQFGPVCTYPPDPTTACGPDACGPKGSCVLSQAIFCDCDDGYHVEMLPDADGALQQYCVDENGVLPQGADAGADTDPPPSTPDAGPGDAGSAPNVAKGGSTHSDSGCALFAGRTGNSAPSSWLFLAALALGWKRRRLKSAC